MKKKCKNCNSSFEAKRKDSLYCSNACRQQNHTKKTTEPIKEDNKTTYTFSQDEYWSFIEEFDIHQYEFSFILYCFLKQNIINETDTIKIKAYISSICRLDDTKRIEYTKSFEEFKEDFLKGKFKISE